MEIIIILFVTAVVFWLLYEWYEHSFIQYSTTIVETEKLTGELRLCLLTDLHNNKKNYSKIIKKIKENQADVIVIAGDLLDKHNLSNKYALELLRNLKEAAPIFYAPGNHESSLAAKQPEAWKTYLEAIPEGVCYLDNDVCRMKGKENVFFSGLTLPKCYYKKGELYEEWDALPELSLPEQGYHILLAHNPEYANLYEKYHADLILSGHLHGGLVRLPKIGGLVSPRLRFPKQDAGLIQLKKGTWLFISRGLGSHTLPLRFFNRVEINFIVLKGTKEME